MALYDDMTETKTGKDKWGSSREIRDMSYVFPCAGGGGGVLIDRVGRRRVDSMLAASATIVEP